MAPKKKKKQIYFERELAKILASCTYYLARIPPGNNNSHGYGCDCRCILFPMGFNCHVFDTRSDYCCPDLGLNNYSPSLGSGSHQTIIHLQEHIPSSIRCVTRTKIILKGLEGN